MGTSIATWVSMYTEEQKGCRLKDQQVIDWTNRHASNSIIRFLWASSLLWVNNFLYLQIHVHTLHLYICKYMYILYLYHTSMFLTNQTAQLQVVKITKITSELAYYTCEFYDIIKRASDAEQLLCQSQI